MRTACQHVDREKEKDNWLKKHCRSRLLSSDGGIVTPIGEKRLPDSAFSIEKVNLSERLLRRLLTRFQRILHDNFEKNWCDQSGDDDNENDRSK